MWYHIYEYKDGQHTVYDSFTNTTAHHNTYPKGSQLRRLKKPVLLFVGNGKDHYSYNVTTQDYEYTTKEGMFTCLGLSNTTIPEWMVEFIWKEYGERKA